MLSKSEPLPISQVDTEVLGLMHQGDDSSSLSPTLEDSLLHPEEELPSTKPIADVAPFKDILDVVAESLPIKGRFNFSGPNFSHLLKKSWLTYKQSLHQHFHSNRQQFIKKRHKKKLQSKFHVTWK